jgi:hypothetical protein
MAAAALAEMGIDSPFSSRAVALGDSAPRAGAP